MSIRRMYCTFEVDRMLLGVEVEHVQEVIRDQAMTRVPLARDVVRGLINLRGQIVTAIDLRRRLGLPDRAFDAEPTNVILSTEDGAVSLLVDEIGDVIEADESELEPAPATLRGPPRALVTGVCKLEDRLLFALDVARTIELDVA